jgi:hypothetical protein
MFKTKSYRSSYSYSKNHRQKRISPRWLILSIPLGLILLEILTRILVNFFGQSEELAAYQGEPPQVNAYRLQFVDENGESYDALPVRGSLVAEKHLALGYQLLGNQQNKYWQINDRGFRDDKPLPLAKPKDEIRIFVLGGSTAFGQGNTTNKATINSKLQALFQQRLQQQKSSPKQYRPDVLPFFKPEGLKYLGLSPKIRSGNYRIINAAVPGYTSGNEMVQLALEILPYKPDAIVVLDGYADLLLPSDETAADIPQLENFMQNPIEHFRAYLQTSAQYWFQESYLVKAAQNWLLRPEPSLAEKTLGLTQKANSLAEYLPQDEAELKRRVDRYRQNQIKMAQFSTQAGIPLIIAVQPEITGRPENRILEDEKAIVRDLGEDYRQKTQKYYPRLSQSIKDLEKAFPKNVKVLNLYNLSDKSSAPLFSDAIHLTEQANTAVAGQIYNSLIQFQQMQVIPANLNLYQ